MMTTMMTPIVTMNIQRPIQGPFVGSELTTPKPLLGLLTQMIVILKGDL